jgi:hypothetical protein
VKTKAFTAPRIRPKTTPDGTSLEERMNVFCATLQVANFIALSVVFGATADNAGDMCTGFIVYKA